MYKRQGFILTELDELKNDVVNYAKQRVSYAEVGQAGDFLENYYSTPTYGGGYVCLLYTSNYRFALFIIYHSISL